MKESNNNKKQIRLDMKFIIIILIVIVVIAFFIFYMKNNQNNNSPKNGKTQNSQTIENTNNEDNVDMKVREQISAFNSRYELFEGGREGEMVASYIDQILEYNKESNDHIVEISYNNNITANESEIMAIKENLKDEEMYEIVLDYDDEGYVHILKIIY